MAIKYKAMTHTQLADCAGVSVARYINGYIRTRINYVN